jgi:hypothetical protein
LYFTRPDDEYTVPLGNFLGDMTDEISKEYGVGSQLTEFVSTGAKSYAYSVQKPNGDVACSVKSKGFTLDYQTGLIMSMTKMKELVFKYAQDGVSERIELESRGIRRTKDHEIVTRQITKGFGVTANKRQLRSDFMTLPYGY